jgi:3-dehydroquinate synthase
MKKLAVKLGDRTYPIMVGSGMLEALGATLKKMCAHADAYIITNSIVRKHYGSILGVSLRKAGISCKYRLILEGEKSKSLHVVSAILNDLARYAVGKKVFVIAFGGGVVGDIAGFVAAIYKRGIPYMQVPTTLLAQVDSAIGGKTGVDLPLGKNLAGAFYQPFLVATDISLLRTLDKRQLSCGMAEIIKYAAIKDSRLFSYLERNIGKYPVASTSFLEHVVVLCSKIKASVVSVDERENKSLRTVLNFGHTIGHAIESAGKYCRYNHGEAVGLGMIVAARLSCFLRLLDEESCLRIERLISQAGLPTNIKGLSSQDIISRHYYDKKFSGVSNRFVLLTEIGRTKIVEDIPLPLIKQVVLGLIN